MPHRTLATRARARALAYGAVLSGGICLLILVGVVAASGAPFAAAQPSGAARHAGTAASATGVSISLGYADSLRANPTHFPSPWAGSPNILFQGCQPATSCTYDGGAIEITNNGASMHTINSVVVKLDTCTYNIWPADTTLPAGDALILAQITSGATSGCTSDGRFDTSDVGPGGVSWSGNCSQSGIIPVVQITIDGTVQTFTDSGQILNTKGVDAAECGVGNESTQWTPVGQVSCTSAQLALAPATQRVVIGAQATVVATLTNSCGNALQNATVDFTVTAGPNAGKAGSATTDTKGQASFQYTSATLGTDTIDATVSNLAGTIASSGAVTIDWISAPTVPFTNSGSATTLKVDAGAQDYDDPTQLRATLTISGAPVAHAPISFTLGTQTCGPVKTTSAGVAICDLTLSQPAGTYPLKASFGGMASYGATQGSATFTVLHEETVAHYTGPTQLAQGQGATLSGTLSEDGTTPIAGRSLILSDGVESCTAKTDANGKATCTTVKVSVPAGTAVTLSVTFTGDAYYVAAQAYQPGQIVTAGRSGAGGSDGPLTAGGGMRETGPGTNAQSPGGLDTPVLLPIFGSSPLWFIVFLAVLCFALVGGGAVILVRTRATTGQPVVWQNLTLTALLRRLRGGQGG